jgi:hypothetical protein
MDKEFVAFIFSHGRAENFFTLATLKRHGYTGNVFIVIDNEDDQAPRYYERFGDKVIMFDKSEAAQLFDVGDNFSDRRAVVYARNYAYILAREMGYKYFVQFEDDYVSFSYKVNHSGAIISEKYIRSLDNLFSSLLEYYKSIPAKCIAICQGGDFIGMKEGMRHSAAYRKAMNSLFCSVDRPVEFVGRMNDDVNTYTESGRRGDLFLNIPFVMLHQLETQKNKGGHSDIYKGFGTYVKSFLSVMYSPSCVKVSMMGAVNQRLHHHILWNNAVSCIIRESYKK